METFPYREPNHPHALNHAPVSAATGPQSTRRLAPNRILVRGVNWLGDAVMTTPALQRLRERFPDAHITLLSPEKLGDLWLGHPGIDSLCRVAPNQSIWRLARRLRQGGFDMALILPNSPRSALEVWLAGIPLRVGYARPWRNWLLTRAIPVRAGRVAMRKRSYREIKRLLRSTPSPPWDASNCLVSRWAGGTEPATNPAHQMHEYLHLVSAVGASPEPLAPRLVVSLEEVEQAMVKFNLRQALEPGRPWFGLSPGAEYGEAKRWPVSRFIAVARQVQARSHCRWILLGGPADRELAEQVVEALGTDSALNLAGQTSLRELCAVLKVCRVFLTNDTGPMHVAAALETPLVALFGSTSPVLTGPGSAGEASCRVLTGRAVCAPCFLRKCPIDFRCMTGIAVENVVESVLQMAARAPGAR